MDLVGVAFIVRSRDGPRFVFHYPPRPRFNVVRKNLRYGTELDPTPEARGDGEDDSDGSDLEDVGFELHKESERTSFVPTFGRRRKKSSYHMNPWDGDYHYDENGTQVVPWEHLDNFDTKDLESILTPARAFHKKKFVLSLDPLVFVTYPIHCYEDGHWKKKRKDKKQKGVHYALSTEAISEPPGSASEKLSTSGNGNEDNSTEVDHGGMTMFNIVFILNPERNETDQKASEIYDNVAKDFNKALQRAQSESNYVWKQADLIMSMKEKAREERRPMSSLWDMILQESSLGHAMRDVFEAISTNRIANIHLDTRSPIDFSVQIPVPYCLRTLPTIQEASMPGLWITTSNSLEIDGDGLPTQGLSRHFALLLLDDEEKIISDIQTEAVELADPLIQFIKISKPTLSFEQIAKTNCIELDDIRTLAQHLIYWRRAIPIPPMHARDTYILSPNADHHKLPTASIAWKKAFPLAPALPSFLATLSATPRPYKSYPPSKNHRPTYMDMLAWLLRNGWVTQLRTFAYILVWPEVIYEVQHALDKAAIEKEKSKLDIESLTKSTTIGSTSSSTSTLTDLPASSSTTTTTTNFSKDTATKAENARLDRLHQKFLNDAAAFAKQPLPTRTAHPDQNKAPHLAHLSPHIILDPHRAEDVETLYIAAIADRLSKQSSITTDSASKADEKRDPKADAKLSKHWLEFVKYFNGKEALESIGVREGMKRKETWGLLVGMQQFLLVVRHW